ncbi:DUF3658 domain-containing protein [Bradyrhizobium sp. S69]|uniref:DUF3658 domain-containing protein n=1 Tax=Bradyrhizobium sp. S69 TaxID=1641856 RepID=UPI00131D8EF0|nr:DUF3658 domain-containing protein [Bradyrhizobium sp. S69]
MAQAVLHFVFTPSGAGCLVQALRKAGRDDRVIASYDDLSFGPINPGDASSRAKWVENELGQTDWKDRSAGSERAYDEARLPDCRKIAWLTRRSAMEYAGFLDWLWRLGDAPCEVVDLTDVTVSHRPEHGPPRPPRPAVSLGLLHHDKICSDKLWDLAEPLQISQRREYLGLWQQLRSENAPLRVIDGGRLVSAPISFFDGLLMSFVTDHWQKAARAIGSTMAMDDWIIQTHDVFLSARVKALAESGSLEIRGPRAADIFSSEVRLPGVRQPS